jgi:hypothetical protein
MEALLDGLSAEQRARTVALLRQANDDEYRRVRGMAPPSGPENPLD